VLVAINVRLGAGEVGYILEHSGSRVLFADPELESLAAEAPAGLEVVRLGDEYERLVASGDPAGVPSLLRDEEEPIAIDHTAGTTGRPKGVVYTYRRGVPQRARRGDRGRARPPPGLPVDAAHVPLQWLVLPVGGDGSRGHARVPAGGRPGADLAAKDGWEDLPAEERARRLARQGQGYTTADLVRVVDEEMRDVPRDGATMGEVVMRGNNVMAGYFADDEATETAFSGGWFHSGDLAVWHPDNAIELRDRGKDVIISGGENISSIEVEQAICAHPAVLEAAVVAVPHDR